MQIVLHALDFPLTEALRQHTDQRFRSALRSYDEHIQRLVVRLSNHNGARGGEGRCCHVLLLLTGCADVVIEDVDNDLYVAIGRAANRAARTLRRRLGRQRDKSRNGRSKIDSGADDANDSGSKGDPIGK